MEHIDSVQETETESVTEMVMYEDDDPIARLEQAKQDIMVAVDDALEIIRDVTGFDSLPYQRAKSYWYGHIVTALDDENSFMGGSMHSLQDSINELKKAGGSNTQELEGAAGYANDLIAQGKMDDEAVGIAADNYGVDPSELDEFMFSIDKY